MVVLKYLLAFLVLSIIIFVHEFGHFIIAKASGVVVEEFSIGMGPRLLKFTKNGTMYSFKLFFFGGSCRMKGEDEDDGDTPPEGSFNAAPLAKRFAIIFAGPLFNFVLAFVLSIVLLGTAGYDPCTIYKVSDNSAAQEAGLKAGDQIVKINHSIINFYGEYAMYTYGYDGEVMNVTYIRDGQKYTTSYAANHVEKDVPLMGVYLDQEKPLIVEVSKEGAAIEAGLLANDVVISIDGVEMTSSADITNAIYATLKDDGSCREMKIIVERDGEQKELSLTPKVSHQDYFDFGVVISGERIMGNPLETVGYAFKEVIYWIKSVFMSFKLMFSGKVSANDVSGPVGIVSAIGDVVEEASHDGGLYVFLNLLNWCIMISANLGVMNLLPIPALDGGRILFLLIELVTRKAVPKDKEALVNIVGFILLMVLMVLILFNDIRKLFMG